MHEPGIRRLRGASLLETMLVFALIAVLVVMGLRQYRQYKWTQNVTQIKQNVARLLEAAGVYYYANCKQASVPVASLSCASLVAAGAFSNEQQCNISKSNPWGQAFQVSVIPINKAGISQTQLYGLEVSAVFTSFTPAALQQLADLLEGVLTGSNKIVWQRLPTQSLGHTQAGIISPGGWSPTFTGVGIGGQHMDSNLWIAKGDLEFFSRYEAQRSADVFPQPPYGFTCPN